MAKVPFWYDSSDEDMYQEEQKVKSRGCEKKPCEKPKKHKCFAEIEWECDCKKDDYCEEDYPDCEEEEEKKYYKPQEKCYKEKKCHCEKPECFKKVKCIKVNVYCKKPCPCQCDEYEDD